MQEIKKVFVDSNGYGSYYAQTGVPRSNIRSYFQSDHFNNHRAKETLLFIIKTVDDVSRTTKLILDYEEILDDLSKDFLDFLNIEIVENEELPIKKNLFVLMNYTKYSNNINIKFKKSVVSILQNLFSIESVSLPEKNTNNNLVSTRTVVLPKPLTNLIDDDYDEEDDLFNQIIEQDKNISIHDRLTRLEEEVAILMETIKELIK